MSEPFLPRIFTVGHSNHEIEAFFKLLSARRIQELVDVRSIPSSGRFPQFKKRNLEQFCARRGIVYRHCPALGNKGVDGGIAALLKQPEGAAAIEELVAAARKATPCGGATAFMCAEADWRDCHRQVVAQQLLQHGVVTTHICRDGSLEPHPMDHVLPAHYGMAPSPSAVDECCTSGAEASYPGDQGGDLELAFRLSLQDSKPHDITADVLGSQLEKSSAPKSMEPSPAELEGLGVHTPAPVVRRWGKKK
eukprot:TRINITY_DN31809_c0_g1_i1.p1 TRINITY_DN31809_c0_g1~~TRINITY_DN31809_c0_g1_i1.p1  ORF type:complete len:250 (+),score=40.46 TRINITY_DN31809_c0_g1_i1:114-863(+)